MEFFRQPDGCDVVAGAAGPAARERAIRVQIKIRPRNGRGSARGNGNSICVVMVQWLGGGGLGGVERPAKGSAVEQAERVERVLRGVGHGEISWHARTAAGAVVARAAGGVVGGGWARASRGR